MFRHLLVPLDGSARAEQGLSIATRLPILLVRPEESIAKARRVQEQVRAAHRSHEPASGL